MNGWVEIVPESFEIFPVISMVILFRTMPVEIYFST